MTLKELREIANRISATGKTTVFVRDGNYVVRYEGVQRAAMRDAELLALRLSREGVNGTATVYNGQKHCYAVNYAEVIVSRGK